MPQAPRRDTTAQRLQEKEAKRARGALSCAECRRLKLKCDKTVPCSSCRRRGCQGICPNGSLITGQGTRFVLADTEQLHQKIEQMSDRIRQLEDALAISQSALVGPDAETHPLLERDLLKIKSSLELHSASMDAAGAPSSVVASTSGSAEPSTSNIQGEEEDEEDEEEEGGYINAFGTLAIRDDGASTFYGRSAGQESLLIGEVAASPSDEASSSSTQYYVAIPSHVTTEYFCEGDQALDQSRYYAVASGAPLPHNLANAALGFPLNPTLPTVPGPLPNPNAPVTLSLLLKHYLPPFVEAMRLIRLYLDQAPWFFGAVTGKQIEDEIIPMWYPDEAPNMTTLPGVSAGKQKQRDGTSHDLALLYMIFCFGSLTDTSLPPPPDNPASDRFYQLTKVALTLDPNAPPDVKSTKNGILDRPPSVATVQTLSLMGIYEGLCSGENSIETTWVLMGLSTKLSQSIGLHRDSARWKLSPAEVQKRRALFWELFITDCWQSLATGRLATFSLPFVDCQLPSDPDSTIASDGSVEPSFPFWKARFGAECVSAVVQGTLTSRAPKYSIIMDLDRKVRDMELPQYAVGDAPQGKGLAETMSHFMPQNYRELTLLYIHRCFFAHALSSNPLDPLKSPYAPSFLAGYRSACTIVSAVKKEFSLFPAQIARFWVLWTHAFSASIMLASVATHASRSKMAPAALLELKVACDLFGEAAKYGGRATKFLPILKRLQGKAQQAYRDANTGLPPNVPNDIFKPSAPEDQKDELYIFGGKTHTLTTKASPISPSSSRSSRASNSSHIAQSESPPAVFIDNPSFANVHQSLISELNSFQPLIREQVQNAYRIGQDVFGGGPMVIDPIRKVPVGRLPAPPSQSPTEHLEPPVAITQERFDHDRAQQQALLEAQYHQQQLEMERLERERLEAQRVEHQRVEYERRELEQQQMQLELQHQQQQQEQREHEQRVLAAQQEAIRLQQAQEQQELRRQQERARQQQREDETRRQMELQRQQQAQAQYPMQVSQAPYRAASGVPVVPVAPVQNVQMPPPPPPTQTHLSHSHSQPNLRQIYQQQQPHSQSRQIPPPESHQDPRIYQQITPQHTGGASSGQTSHHPMYANPQSGYSTHGRPSPDSMDSTSNYTPPSTSYSSSQQAHPRALAYSQPHPQLQPSADVYQQQGPPQPMYQSSTPASASFPIPTPTAAPYIRPSWNSSASSSNMQSFSMPVDPPSHQTQMYAQGQVPNLVHAHSGHALHQPVPQPHYQHYTPEGALHGIAADDKSLQETWQVYMNEVGSPRQFFED